MAGYTRQSLAAIQDGEDIIAAPLNAEFNQLQDAFNAVTGHTHDGTIGNSAKINLTGAAAVTGILPDANLPTTMGGKTFTGAVTIQNTLTINHPSSNSQIEMGRIDGVANTPTIDFHSSGAANDYDSRIIANGGTTNGTGSLQFLAGGGHTFVGQLLLSSGLNKNVDNSVLLINGGISSGANIELYGPTHATTPNQMKIDSNTTEFRNANGSGTPSVLIGGSTVWHAGNDGTGSGLDAGLLEGNDAAFYRNASNLNAGTISDSRLPTSMAGKTFTSTVDLRSGAPILQFTETDASNKAWFIVADGTTWSVRENDTGTTRFRIDAGGNATFFQQLTVTGALNGSSADFSGSVDVLAIASTAGNIYTRAAGNRHVWFQTSAGVTRGLIFHDNTGNAMHMRVYNSGGSFVNGFIIDEAGAAQWTANVMRTGSGGATSSSEYQMWTNSASQSHRIIGDSSGNLTIQKSNDRFVSNATTLLQWNSSNLATFSGNVTITGALNLTGSSNGIELGARGVSNTPFIDFHSSATDADYQARIIASGGTGTAGSGTLTFDGNCAFNKNVVVGSATYQTDGNILFTGGMQSGFGNALNDALGARAVIYTGTGANDTNLAIGHMILVFKTATGPIRNATIAPCLSAVDSIYYRTVGDANAGTALSGTWRVGGDINAGSDFFTLARRVA